MSSLLKSSLDCPPVPSLTSAEVADGLRSGAARVFDCNPPRVWMRGHVPGAVNLDPAGFGPADLLAPTETMLVFYGGDESCGAAAFAARRARALGYPNVRVMPAGLAGWEDEGRPVEHIRPKRSAAR